MLDKLCKFTLLARGVESNISTDTKPAAVSGKGPACET